MNKAFVDLKKVLPKIASATKMDLLSSAKDYIQHLTDVLQETFGKDIKSILNGHKLRKICGIRTSQLMPYKELPEAMFQFTVQSPKSAIPFQDETTSSPNFMNPENDVNELLFLSPLPVDCQHRGSQVSLHEDPPEPVFEFAVQNPKSTIPFQNEAISSPNFANQGHVTDDLGLSIGPPLSNPKDYTQVTAKRQSLVQPFVKPETWNHYPKPVPLPNHRVTNGENMSYSTTGLGVPSMVCVSQDIRQTRNNTPILQPTLSDELDQFCCEIFDILAPGDKGKPEYETFFQSLTDFPLI